MEIRFNEGNVESPMSDAVQNRFFRHMGKVSYVVIVTRVNKVLGAGSGFYISQNDLLVTAAHLLKNKKIDEYELVLYARRHGEDVKLQCQVLARSFDNDITLLRFVGAVHVIGSVLKPLSDFHESFDYVDVTSLEGVDLIHVAREVFMMGGAKGQGFHMVRGTVAYGHDMREVDCSDLTFPPIHQFKYDIKESPLYNDKLYRTAKGCWFEIGHSAQVPYLQVNGLPECKGFSEGPIFYSTSKVLVMITLSNLSKTIGLPTTSVFSHWLQHLHMNLSDLLIMRAPKNS